MKNISLLPLFFLFLSCNHNKTDVAVISSRGCVSIPVDLSSSQNLEIGKAMGEIFYVKLETNEESIIGSVNKVFCDEGKIFVFDKKTESILIFNSGGKFLTKIASKGSGPKEYIFLEDVNLNKTKKRIEIADAVRNRVLFFNYQGEFAGEQKFNENIYHFLVSNSQGDFLFHHQQSDCDATINCFNSKGKIKSGFFKPDGPSDIYNYFALMRNPIAKKGNAMAFLLSRKESIYSVENDSCKEAFRFVFGKNRYVDILDDYYKSGGLNAMSTFYKKYNLPIGMDDLYFTDHVFCVSMILLPNVVQYFYNFTNNKGVLVRNWHMKTRLAFIPESPVGTDNQYFISSIASENVAAHFETFYKYDMKKIDPKGYKVIESLYKKTNPEDNPVLMFWELKL